MMSIDDSEGFIRAWTALAAYEPGFYGTTSKP